MNLVLRFDVEGQVVERHIVENLIKEATYCRTGTNVMITIFCDFCLFSAKKLAFFSKTNVMITFSAKLPFI
jgi:hypothetical protein